MVSKTEGRGFKSRREHPDEANVEQWIKTRGKLAYDPTRREFKKTYKTRTLIAELPRDQIDLYYQWFIKKQYGEWLSLQRPMWGIHVTVVRGNEPVPKLDLWKIHADRWVEFEYGPFIRHHWGFWSLPVRSVELIEIRRELGLKAEHDFHITVGRQVEWQREARWFK